MLQQLKIWGIDVGGDSIDFEKPIGTFEGEAFKPFYDEVEIEAESVYSLPENASGIVAFGAGEHSAIGFVNADGSVSVTASTSAVNGDNPSVAVGNLTENDAVEIANLTDEPLDVQVFFLHSEQND